MREYAKSSVKKVLCLYLHTFHTFLDFLLKNVDLQAIFPNCDRLEGTHGNFPEPGIFETRGDPNVFEFETDRWIMDAVLNR